MARGWKIMGLNQSGGSGEREGRTEEGPAQKPASGGLKRGSW